MSIPGFIFALFVVTLGNKSQLQNTTCRNFSRTRQITNIGTFVIHRDANKWLDILKFSQRNIRKQPGDTRLHRNTYLHFANVANVAASQVF